MAAPPGFVLQRIRLVDRIKSRNTTEGSRIHDTHIPDSVALGTQQRDSIANRNGSGRYRSILLTVLVLTIVIGAVGSIVPTIGLYPGSQPKVSVTQDSASVEKMRVDFMRRDLINALAILNFNNFQNIVWATGVPYSQFPPPDAPRSEHVDAILDYVDHRVRATSTDW